MLKLEGAWGERLKGEFEKEYWKNLESFVEEEYATKTVYPPKEEIFRAFDFCPYEEVKVVLVGQDPYHGEGQAEGLSFSVKKGQKIPPSLRNIYKELAEEYEDFRIPSHGSLEAWAKQGILLLNTSLTVRAREAASHAKKGWEIFTDAVIAALNEREEPVIFLLWGNHAKARAKKIDGEKHYIIEGVHPSPLSARRGFFGAGHFRRVNEILESLGKKEISWQIEE